MKKLLHSAAATVVGLSLTTGVAAAQTNVSVSGPNGHANVYTNQSVSSRIANHSSLGATNNNPQWAYTGGVVQSYNTYGGTAQSGSANNQSSFNVSGSVSNNSGAGAYTAALTPADTSATVNVSGPNADATVTHVSTSNLNVTNDTDLQVTNNNYQAAASGFVQSSYNTNGGSVMSGNASNNSTTSVNFNVNN